MNGSKAFSKVSLWYKNFALFAPNVKHLLNCQKSTLSPVREKKAADKMSSDITEAKMSHDDDVTALFP